MAMGFPYNSFSSSPEKGGIWMKTKWLKTDLRTSFWSFKVCCKDIVTERKHVFLITTNIRDQLCFTPLKGFSSNINEAIRSVLNFLFFFTIRFHKYKKAQNIIKTIQFFNRFYYSMFRSYVSRYIYYFSGTSVIKIILIFNWVLINYFLFI